VASAFEKRLGGAGQRGKKGGVGVGVSAWRSEKEERGGAGVAVDSSGQPVTAPDRRVRAALLPHE
jgi:hypothetical protein